MVERADEALRVLPDQSHPGIRSGEILDNPRCFVGGSVVHDDQLKVSQTLFEHAAARRDNPSRAIPDGHDDADTRSV